MSDGSQSLKKPERFHVTHHIVWFDHFMNYFIVVGGAGVIAAVLGIFVFIFLQVLPLFQGAAVSPLSQHKLTDSTKNLLALDMDEWAELPVLIYQDGRLEFLDIVGNREPIIESGIFEDEGAIAALNYNSTKRLLVAASTSGKFAYATVGYRAEFDSENHRTIHPEVTRSPWFQLAREDERIHWVDYGEGDANKMGAAWCVAPEGRPRLRLIILEQQRTLFSEGGQISIGERFEFQPEFEGKLQQLDVSSNGDLVLLTTTRGEVLLYVYENNAITLRQRLRPFASLPDASVLKAEFLLGDLSVVFVGVNGVNEVYSLALDESQGERLLIPNKQFKRFKETARDFFPGVRNKSFLLTGAHHASLRYSTTEKVRWHQDFEFEIAKGIIGEKYDRIGFLDASGLFHLYRLDDPHPQAGLTAFFGKIQYEGQTKADYVWQSTGGTDDFEPKLSMVPLIIGSLKGTFYALLFAVPIALLAALYTSQFLESRLKEIIKPTMEIMASLPSVVLGFLAALWLAPRIDTHVPSILLMALGIPLSAVFFAWIWIRLPDQTKSKIPTGIEFMVLTPAILLVCYGCWHLGPVFEKIFFVVTDPVTGEQVADFRLWWPEATGATYTQRNSLIVGFMMGFAVIPIIFTIAEDAMSNVPGTMRSGSLALGASRWQTAVRIVLPTASAGIFSALMVGFGRAVGETMIVVMATGNTPVKDFNIFSGMRTLSANIAVELPEAPYLGTLYRTLFLGALVLFIMTFVVNTLAELLREKLRDRYKVSKP